MTEDTPPHGTRALPPPRPLPNIATVQTTVEVCIGQLKGLRLEVEALSKLIRDPPPDVLRISVPPVSGPQPPRPSMAAKAAQGTTRVGKWILIGTGALTVLSQALTMLDRPELGPVVQALRVLLAALGGSPP